MPLPMMEFSTSPVKLQRPMARTSSGRACLAVEAPKDRDGGSVACVSSGLTASSVAELEMDPEPLNGWPSKNFCAP